MNCPACAHANRPGAKFCEECAAPLPRACASCGAELRPSAKFCDECGTPAGVAAAARPAAATDARKVVTIVFADLVGSTALHERLDLESARRFMEGYYAAMRGAVESHGGTVTQFLGDGVKAVFGIPRVAEDDAIRAVRAAVAMQAAFRAHADPQREAIGKTGLRVAVNTGEVVANDASEIIGDPVNVAARLQEQGRDGDVVVGETTERLVSALVTLERLGSFALKGRTEAVSAYRVTSLERPVGAAAAAFVGRDEELARILSVYDTAVDKPATALAVLLGSPGLGKSRLIEEFARRLGDGATLIHAHCDAAGGATFAPLADALRALPDLDTLLPGSDAERARVLDGVRALLAGSPAPPEETFFVVRRLLAALASTRPVVLVIDDVHWAEPLLLDLIEHLVQWGVGVPLLVLIGARPELREIRSTLVTPGGLVSEVVTLSGLDAGAAMRLAANVIGAPDLPASVAAKVLAASEGNPLFVGELVRMLVHEGALKREGERWTAGTALAALEMPPTIHALLAARIERLRPEERIVLERAAVIGRSFSRSAVAELLSRDVTDLDARLESLRRAELIERDTGWFLGEPLLRFHHVLIRDAAYRRILKGTRAELHARFADWIEKRAGDSLEHDETIGWHLEQAHQHLRELGPIDARGRVLGERAAQRLAAAGRRALARDDVPLASGLLGRALDRLDRDDAARAELALDWCEALLAAGDVAPATAALEELDRFAASDARLRAWYTCFAGQLKVLTAPSGLLEAAESVATASRELAELGDVAGEAKAHFVHAQAFARLGKVAACEAALDRALAAARRAGDRRRANTVLAIAPLAALWGPSPVTRASGRCLDVVRVLRITQGAPAVEAVALSCQGVLEALRGRTDAARRMIASARKMVEELGITQRMLEADVFAARIDLLDGDAAAAERGLRSAYEGMRERGLGIDAARAAALLARALLALDRAPEAEALSHDSERLAGDDLQAAIAWRGARAEALARRGETTEAVALASQAVEIAAATDALLDHADARLALAAALRAAGRNAEADTEEGRATELWVAKGATLLAERARGASPQPAATALQPDARPVPDRPARQRVRPNRASAAGPRFEAAAAARDFAALEQVFSDPCVVVHHPTGVTYGRREQLKTWKSLFGAEQLTYRRKAVATLGDSLELARHYISASGFPEERLKAAGGVEIDEVVICEDDGHGRHGRFEIFADGQLGQAIARLYERHAELLPDGPQRVRARAIATTASVMLGQPDLAATATVLAPDVEFSDLRTVGFGTLRGAHAVLQTIAAMMDLSHGDSARIDDVLVLESDALVVRWTNRGTHVESGGAFERKLCQLFAFDAAGRLSRWQQFEAEHDAAALARFDALVAREQPKPSVRRRVRANAASRNAERSWAATHARDVEAFKATNAAQMEVIHHPTGATYGEAEVLAMSRAIWRTRSLSLVQEPLATLGESLALIRRSYTHDGSDSTFGSVGDSEGDYVVLCEVDERGLCKRSEVFAADHLGDAIARLYERYAEILPAGEERERAATTARSLAVLEGPVDLDVWVAVMSPDIEQVDHRLLSTWSASGAAEVLGHLRALREVSNGTVLVDDVLAASPDLLLVRQTNAGTDRESGGRYERVFLRLFAFARDGRISRFEFFEAEREAEALARFDAFVAREEPKRSIRRRVRPNLAGETLARMDAACAARDVDAVRALHREDFEEIHHPTGSTYGLDGAYASLASLLRLPNPRMVSEQLATLDDRLVLARRTMGATSGGRGRIDTGPWDREEISAAEVDEQGRFRGYDTFGPERLADAIVRLYKRRADSLPDGIARIRAAATAQSLAALLAPPDIDRIAASVASSVETIDHKVLGYGRARGAENVLRAIRIQIETAEAIAPSVDDVLALEPSALLVRRTVSGVLRDGGGAYEKSMISLYVCGDDGLVERWEQFDPDREAEALARFDALVGAAATEPASEPFANSASRADAAQTRCFNARDWEGAVACVAPEFVFDERRRMARNTCGRDVWMEQFRLLFDVPASRFTMELLATRGERLSLSLNRFEGLVAGGGGPLEMEEHYAVVEVDCDGRMVATVLFDSEHLDAAHAELDARFDVGEGAAYAHVVATARARERAFANRDWDAWGATRTPGFRYRDHRLLGWGTGDVPAGAQMVQSLVELAPDVRQRCDHLRLCERGAIQQMRYVGTRDGGAFEIVYVAVTEGDALGRVVCNDTYDVDQFELAQARFEELRTNPPAPFENAASRADRTLLRCFNERDWPGIEACTASELVFDERRRILRNTCGRDVWLEQFRLMFDVPASRFTSVLHATRGERLSLNLHRFEGEVADGGGPLAMDDHFALHEVDRQGRIVAIVLFDQNDLDAAYAELDARYAAGGDDAHAASLTVMREFAHAVASREWDRMLALCSPTLVEQDHRPLAVLGTTRGAEAWVQNFRTLAELAPDSRYRVDHFRASVRGFCSVGTWVGTREGGPYEIPLVAVLDLDGQDRIARADIFDFDQLDRARARFDALAGRGANPSASPFANVASRLIEGAAARLWAVRDWAGIVAAISPAMRMDDRRRLIRLEIGYDDFLAQFRMMFDQPGSRWRLALLATRGERLSLHRTSFEAEVASGGGPLAVDEHLSLSEVDGGGRWIASVTFDLEDLDAAYAELDARFEAGEASAHPQAVASMLNSRRALEARDWDAHAALFTPDLVCHDHRVLGWGTLHGAAAFVRTQQVLIELAPDSRWRNDHILTSQHGHFQASLRFGTREGGEFELEVLRVSELDEHGKIRRIDIYDPDRVEEARARFFELGSSAKAPAGRFENVASRALREAIQAWGRRDAERYARLHPPELRYRDHRRMLQLDLDREQFLEFSRPLLEMAAGVSVELFATRGDRLALFRQTMEMAGDEVGPSAIDSLLVAETAENGAIVALERFDEDDLDAAHAELRARFDSGEAAAHASAGAWLRGYLRCFATRDWAGLRALFAPDLVGHNHRLVGWGTLRGPEALVATLEAQVPLAPDTRERVDHVRLCERGVLFEYAWLGSHDGGDFENVWIVGAELDARGRATRVDVWEQEQLAVALARFEELHSDPLRVPENAAARHVQARLLAKGDEAKLRALVGDDFCFDDRGRRALVRGGIEEWLGAIRFMLGEKSAQGTNELVATAGDRLALHHVTWRETPGEPSFRIDRYRITEIDAAGKLHAVVMFDADQREAASTELFERWVASGADGVPAAEIEFLRAWNAHDVGRMRALLPDDFVHDDRRRAGLGRVEGADAYVASSAALYELSPDVRIEALYCAAAAKHARVSVVRRFGTNTEGGQAEAYFIRLPHFQAERLVGVDAFELDDMDAALARFAELRPDPLRVPENAAGRHLSLRVRARADETALRSLAADDFTFDDRGRRALVHGGIEEWLSALRFLVRETGAHSDDELVATAGDRFALHRVTWREAPGEPGFQIVHYRLSEVDAAGKLRTFVLFDDDQRADAHTELFERFVASGADGVPAAAIEYLRAFNSHDLARLRGALHGDFVFDDHRRAGAGRLEGADAHIPYVAAGYELTRDLRSDVMYIAAAAPHGLVVLTRAWGANTEGGEFESFYVALLHYRGEQVVASEFYDPEDLERALARFEELRPDPQRIPESAATRARDRHHEAFVARDWERLRALAATDFVFDDRGKRALVTGDVETWLGSMKFMSQPGYRADSALLAALGDRICLDLVVWRAKPGGDAFEFDRIRVVEVDGNGRLRALLYFDPEDRRAAFGEATARFASGEAAGCVAASLLAEFLRALNERDWPALRETYTADFALTDLRPLGLGELDLDTWIASLQATVELSVGLAFEISRVLAWNDRGIVVVLRRHGSMPDGGGRFENFPIGVALIRDDRIARYEILDEADAERALARFAELCAAIEP